VRWKLPVSRDFMGPAREGTGCRSVVRLRCVQLLSATAATTPTIIQATVLTFQRIGGASLPRADARSRPHRERLDGSRREDAASPCLL
jgi:hypothetical protein